MTGSIIILALLAFLACISITGWTFRFVARMRAQDSNEARAEIRNQALVDLDQAERAVADDYERQRNASHQYPQEELGNAYAPSSERNREP